MPESKHEAIEAAVANRLAAVIVHDGGTTYWHTAGDRVYRRPAFKDELLTGHALATPDALFVVIPDEEDSEYSGSFTDMEGFIHLGIVAATPYGVGAEMGPRPSSTLLRTTVQNRLLQDIRRAIQTDQFLNDDSGNGLALWANVARASKVPRETFKDGWAIAFAEVEIHHTYAGGDPS